MLINVYEKKLYKLCIPSRFSLDSLYVDFLDNTVLLCNCDRFMKSESCSECSSKAFQNKCSPFCFCFFLAITPLYVGMPNIWPTYAGNQLCLYCTFQLGSTEPAAKMYKLIRHELTQSVLVSESVKCHSQSIVFFRGLKASQISLGSQRFPWQRLAAQMLLGS